MPITKINGTDFKMMVSNGAINLANNYKHVDDLNVFPVPDGDTGTNMKMTIENGVSELQGFDSKSIHEVSKKLSRGLLMGARGNSGVILSQLFRGIYQGALEKDEVSGLELVDMFISGANQAYKAVMKPVEGTVLTVARVAAEETKKVIDYKDTPLKVLEVYLENAIKALETTPELLPKLKEAGVVDSGGTGYVLIIEGMYKALKGEFITPNEVTSPSTLKKVSTVETEGEEYGYCTEFIVRLNDPSENFENYVKSKLAKIGNSIVCVQDDDLLKVHVHTLTPGVALNIAQKYGEFIKLKIENMSFQHEELLRKEIEAEKAEEAQGEPKKYGVVAVAQGEGIVRSFYEFGVDRVVTGGQTMNPSTQDFIDVIDKINAENIIIFPNNKNILLAATQAKELVTDKNIIVINCFSVAEGYTALSLLELDLEPDEIQAAIEDTISGIKVGELTYAVRDTKVNNVQIKKDDYMSIIDGKIVASINSKFKATCKLMDLILKDAEICTCIYGNDVTEDELNKVAEYVNKKHPKVEIDFIKGEQDVYSYLLSVE